VSSAAQRVPSFDELYQAIEALPPGLSGEILEPGVIRTMGRPGGRHRFSARFIWRSLSDDDAALKGRGWWIEQEAEIRFPEDKLAVPDLSGWRLAADDEVPPSFVFENPIVRRPDWCCELLSSSTRDIDRNLKLPLYARAGVEWIWLVDPEAREIEVLRTKQGKPESIEKIEGEATRAIPPFSSIVDTASWWLPPEPAR
jgi:Uma2 family endonuclease